MVKTKKTKSRTKTKTNMFSNLYKTYQKGSTSPVSEKNLSRFVNKQTKKNKRRRHRPMKKHPIKMVIPPWIDKKYIKNGRVDWEAYGK
jgi:hypothetical protein